MFFAPRLVFRGIAGEEFRFRVLRSLTHFPRYRERRFPISCLAHSNTILAVPWASDSFFMFCAAELVFGGTEGVGSCFLILLSRTHFRRFRGRQVQFSCFTLPNFFSAVPWVSSPFFMFYAPEIVFGGTEGVWSHFHVFRSRPHFRRFRERRVQFSCFVLPNSFSAEPWASRPFFMFGALGLVFGGT
jgi:hypothetical protein